jgi:hypothetical protein
LDESLLDTSRRPYQNVVENNNHDDVLFYWVFLLYLKRAKNVELGFCARLTSVREGARRVCFHSIVFAIVIGAIFVCIFLGSCRHRCFTSDIFYSKEKQHRKAQFRYIK